MVYNYKVRSIQESNLNSLEEYNKLKFYRINYGACTVFKVHCET